jgi:hypothetical protein
MPFSTGRLDFLPNIGFDDFLDSPDDLVAVEIKQPAEGLTRVYAEGALSGFGTQDNHLVFSPKDVIAAKGSKTSNKADFSTRKTTNDYLDSIKGDSGQVFSFFTYGGVNVPSDDILHYLVFRNGSSPAIAAFEQQNSNLYLAFIEGEEDASPLTWKNLSNASNDWVDVPVEDFITPKADYVVTSSRIKQKGKEIDFKLFFGAEAGSFTIPAGSNITIATFKTAYAPGVAVSGAVFNSAIHYQSGDIPTATAYLNGAANLLYRTNTDVVLGTNPKLKICGRYIRD